MTKLLVLFSMLGVLACDSAGDASCADCQTSFTTAECDSFAKSQGCTSGEAVVDTTFCQGSTTVTSCHFHGCPTDTPIMCQTVGGDAGTD